MSGFLSARRWALALEEECVGEPSVWSTFCRIKMCWQTKIKCCTVTWLIYFFFFWNVFSCMEHQKGHRVLSEDTIFVSWSSWCQFFNTKYKGPKELWLLQVLEVEISLRSFCLRRLCNSVVILARLYMYGVLVSPVLMAWGYEWERTETNCPRRRAWWLYPFCL